MVRRFNLILILFCAAFWGASGLCADSAPQTDQSSETLEMVAKRMRSLTNSLEGIPQPPALDRTIQLPDSVIQLPKNIKLEKEKK